MTERLNNRDWRLISAYLDARLSPAKITKVDERLKNDPLFKQALDEIAYTKRLLAALPQKRAPRNFTLAAEKVKRPLRGLWLQPALSFVSVVAAALLVVVFSFNYLVIGIARQAAAPQAQMLAAESAVADQEAPVIINWNPILGMGGGDAADAKQVYTGGDGLGGAGGPGFPVAEPGVGGGAPVEEIDPSLPPEDMPAVEITDEPALDLPVEPAPEEPAPIFMSEAAPVEADPSTLILGIPQPEDTGMLIQPEQVREDPGQLPARRLPARTLLMITSGIIAALAGAGAIILRKITHA